MAKSKPKGPKGNNLPMDNEGKTSKVASIHYSSSGTGGNLEPVTKTKINDGDPGIYDHTGAARHMRSKSKVGESNKAKRPNLFRKETSEKIHPNRWIKEVRDVEAREKKKKKR